MEALSQLDVHNPDHVSVITRDGRVTISVIKDGTSVTLGFQVKNAIFDTTPRPPLQQPVPNLTAVKEPGSSSDLKADRTMVVKRNRTTPIGNCKLTSNQVREIKHILNDGVFIKAFGSRQQAYEAIADKYKVSYHTISNIHKGLAWRQVNV